jgi:methionine synthase / methylenetetrahydrofolate reductase(NADPH)
MRSVKRSRQRAKETCTLPVVASVTFTRDDRTLLGDDPIKVARMLQGVRRGCHRSQLFGRSCSASAFVETDEIRLFRRLKFWVKPNAGWPEQVGGRIMYPADAEYFGDYALSFREAGACIVGGCCGTTPQHIAAMRKALDTAPAIDSGPSSLRSCHRRRFRDRAGTATPVRPEINALEFAISVEMDPPRGLSTHKLIAGASLLADAGADVINVADSPMARMRMSAWAVCDVVQRKVGVETTLHFPTRGRNLLRVQGDLLAAHALGIRNVFVVMGDPTSIGDYPEAMDNYDLVPSGLIKLIKQGFNTGVDHSGTSIGQPTNFFVGAALNLCPADVEARSRTCIARSKQAQTSS